jgi:hypothetical protein
MKAAKRAVRVYRRSCSVELIALGAQLQAGTLSEQHRRIAERLLPGVCDLVGRLSQSPVTRALEAPDEGQANRA